ncbi:MAG: ribosomal RNA small subunit methyltransferase A [Leptolyngbya sp. PLA1]|nr:ribosomal RNA small subunit methyltransferase A [Leptolyngbya sp. PLA1]
MAAFRSEGDRLARAPAEHQDHRSKLDHRPPPPPPPPAPVKPDDRSSILPSAVQTLAEIKELLASAGLSPRHAFGQNFLIDHNLIRRLVDASGVAAGDTVLEIGPGTGTLTDELLDRGCRVVAGEIDRGLCALLRERYAGRTFTLIEGDCLASKHALNPELLAALGPGQFRLVANLPYGAATPVMLSLLADVPACTGLFVTIQREVADRLMARPSTKDYGTISVVAQAVAEVRMVATLPPECFWPRPDVTSAMVRMTRLAAPLTARPRALADFCQSLFEKRRKQLGAVLGRDHPWPAGVLPTDRAEALSVTTLVALHNAVTPA